MASKSPEIMARVGLALGRFRPPHHGHLWFIESAFARCGWLHLVSPTIVGSSAGQQLHSGSVWSAFSNHAEIHIAAPINDPHLPVSWANYVRAFLQPAPTHLFSCDPGAQALADALRIPHEIIDAGRNAHPIQATMIRDDMEKHFHLIVPSARHLYALRVGIVGAEGSGKSTLARELGALLDAPIVEDPLLHAARAAGGIPSAADFQKAIDNSAVRVGAIAAEASTGLVLSEDTVFLTYAWAERLNIKVRRPQNQGYSLTGLDERIDVWLLCHNDFPYTGPKERDEPVGRRTFFETLRERLRAAPRGGANVFEVRGDGQERVEMAAAALREWRTSHLQAKAALLK